MSRHELAPYASLVILGLVAACLSEASPRAPASQLPTLQVTNAAAVPVTVYLRGFRVGRVRPGRVSCIRLRNAPPTTPVSIGLQVGELRVYTPRELFRPGKAWRVRVGPNPEVDVISLRPGGSCR